MKTVFSCFLAFFFSTIGICEDFSILVRKIDGKTITIDVTSEMLVDELRDKIADKTGVPKVQSRLSRAGRPLDDDRTLGSYNIEANSTVCVLLRLRSGPVNNRFQ